MSNFFSPKGWHSVARGNAPGHRTGDFSLKG